MLYSPFVPFLIMEFLMERRLLWFFLVSWEIAFLQSTCAIHFRSKPKRKHIRKCRGGWRKVRKIKVLTILRHQNRCGGQIGCNPGNLIEINIINNLSSKSTCKESFRIGLFNARSVGTGEKRNEIKEFVTDQAVFFLTETWLRYFDDEIKLLNYTINTFARNGKGGGIAMLAKNFVAHRITYTRKFTFNHTSFELVHATLVLHNQTINFFCIYHPPPNRKNKNFRTCWISAIQSLVKLLF